jgi:hypothetical protein
MRCFFHLVDSGSTIRDEEGVEISDLGLAREEAYGAIREFRDEEPATDVAGWHLVVTDAAGAALLSIALDDLNSR